MGTVDLSDSLKNSTSSSNGTLRWAAFLLALGEYIDGYDLLVMGAALLFLKPEFGLSSTVTGFLGSAAFLGAVVGMFVFGPIADRLGRRVIFVFNLIVFVGFSILSAFVTNVPELFVARFFVGVAVGMDIPANTAFLAEIAPSAKRGRYLGTLPNVLWVGGAITATVLGIALLGTGPDAWRWMFGLAAIPALFILIGRQTLPESPRWLVKQGKIKEAAVACQRLGIPMPEIPESSTPSVTSFGQLFRPEYRSRAIIVALVFGLDTLAGPITTLATPYILKFGGLMSNESSLLFSLATYCVDLLGLCTGFFLIDRINRRILAYFSAGLTGLLATAVGVTGFHTGALLLVLYLALAYCLWSGLAALVWVWSSELFPTHLRSTGQGFANGVGRIGIVITSFIVPIGIATAGVRLTIVFFSVPLFAILAIVATHQFFGTNGKTLEQISPN